MQSGRFNAVYMRVNFDHGICLRGAATGPVRDDCMTVFDGERHKDSRAKTNITNIHTSAVRIVNFGWVITLLRGGGLGPRLILSAAPKV